MNKSLEPNLHNLLPSLAGPIPSKLLDLATSLLAQSHTRISNLKANEEIARSYVCAHLACERLKNKIDIPTISPNPPLPPKDYSKLLSYFKTSLAPVVRPSIRARNAPAPAARVPDDLDPSLVANLKVLCTRLNAPNAYIYIYNGIQALLTAPENSTVCGKTIVAISAAVGILVIERLSSHDKEIPIGNVKWTRGKEYKAKSREVMAVLAEVTGTKGLQKRAVDDWVQKLSQQGFKKWPWMQAVPDGVGAGESEVLGVVKKKEEVEELKEMKCRKRKAEVQPSQSELKTRKAKAESIASSAKVPAISAAKRTAAATTKTATVPKTAKSILKPRPRPKPKTTSSTKTTSGDAGGGGRMLQDRVDYLTEKKKNSFQKWKLQVLERCAEIEAL